MDFFLKKPTSIEGHKVKSERPSSRSIVCMLSLYRVSPFTLINGNILHYVSLFLKFILGGTFGVT